MSQSGVRSAKQRVIGKAVVYRVQWNQVCAVSRLLARHQARYSPVYPIAAHRQQIRLIASPISLIHNTIECFCQVYERCKMATFILVSAPQRRNEGI